MYLMQGAGLGQKIRLHSSFFWKACAGENPLYHLSETKGTVARSHGWSLNSISLFELSAIDSLAAQAETTVFHPSGDSPVSEMPAVGNRALTCARGVRLSRCRSFA